MYVVDFWSSCSTLIFIYKYLLFLTGVPVKKLLGYVLFIHTVILTHDSVL